MPARLASGTRCGLGAPAVALAPAAATGAAPLERLAGCSRVAADWADGDSFPVRTADGRQLTIRLRGADCFEWHVRDDTDARFIIDPNTAARDELMRLPGIGEALANRIGEARPFARIDDLDQVRNIGPETRAKTRPRLQIGGW